MPDNPLEIQQSLNLCVSAAATQKANESVGTGGLAQQQQLLANAWRLGLNNSSDGWVLKWRHLNGPQHDSHER